MRKILAFSLLTTGVAFANPHLNINVDDTFIYENIQASKKSKEYILSIKPLPNIYSLLAGEKIKPLMNSLEKDVSYLKPVNTVKFSIYNTNADYLLLEGQSGLSLRKGVNAILLEDGQLSYKRKFIAYYQLRQIFNKDLKQGQVLRTYAKFIFGKFSFEAGKDNVNWGNGEYGLLLSNNAYPFPLIKLSTEKPLYFAGKWKFSILNGWLQEDRKDVSNPQILGIRVVWKPFSFLEIGGTKTTMYGGKGRPGYKLTEYWNIITSSKDNIPGNKYDNDSYAGYDFALYLPLKWFDTFKLYYEEAGTDIEAVWQKEDRGHWARRFPYIFALLSRAYKGGVFLSKGKNIFRFEYVLTPDNYYIHHWYYYEGYTYKGYSLGYPYGRDVETYFLKYVHWFNNKNWIELKGSYYKQPYENSKIKTKNYFISLEYGKVINNLFQIKPFIRYDSKKGIDKNYLPTQYNLENKNKTYLTLGLTLTIRF